MPDKPQDKAEELDFTKLSPGMQGYITELRQEVKKARKERDELKRQLEAKPPPPDVHNLSKRDYKKAKAEAMRNLVHQERERKDAAILSNITGLDAKKMTSDELRQFERKFRQRG